MNECEECGEELDGSENHLIEAYELTGKLLCDDCFHEACDHDDD